MGEILDLRDKTTCPNLINISSYHAVKVQQLLVKALESQIEVLRNTLRRSGQEARDEDDEEDEDDTKRSESEKLIKELQTELRSVLKFFSTHQYIAYIQYIQVIVSFPFYVSM